MDADVVVVGCGCAGFFAARELAGAGLSVLMIGKPSVEGHASSKNFGWLHSGGTELIANKPAYAEECARGAAILCADFGEAVQRSVEHGVFVFADEPRASRFATQLAGLGHTDIQLDAATRWIPATTASLVAVKTPDTVFSPSIVMRSLTRSVLADPRVQFMSHEAPESLVLTVTDDGVDVEDEAVRVARAPHVVQALGVHARTLGSAGDLELGTEKVSRYTMFVATSVVTDHVIAGPFIPNEYPGFLIPHPEAGRTIILTGLSIEPEHDSHPSTTPDIETARKRMQSLWDHFPRLPRQLSGEFYVCHRFKTKNGAIVRTAGRITAFYPGYFGIAPYAAKRLASEVRAALHPTWATTPDDGARINVAPTKYMTCHDEHRLERH